MELQVIGRRRSQSDLGLLSDHSSKRILEQPKWKSLFAFTQRSHRMVFSLAVSADIVSGALFPFFALLLGQSFKALSDFGAGLASVQELNDTVTSNIILLAVFALTTWISNASSSAFSQVFGELQSTTARSRVFNVLLNRDVAWFDVFEEGAGNRILQIQSDLHDLRHATSRCLGSVLQFAAMAIAAITLALSTAWDLALVIMGMMPLAMTLLNALSSHHNVVAGLHYEGRAAAVAVLKTAMSTIETVKCFQGQSFESSQYIRSLAKAAKRSHRQATITALQMSSMRFITLAIFAQGFWYGGQVILNGKRTTEDIVTVFWACVITTYALQEILPHMVILEKGRAAAARLQQDAFIPRAQRSTKQEISVEAGDFRNSSISLSNVNFSYPSRPHRYILHDINMLFSAGKTTFILGKNGSGKSTLVNLLAGFYDYEGDMKLGHKSMRGIDAPYLRKYITCVYQQSRLFDEDLLGNIVIGQEGYYSGIDQDLQNCIQFAALDDTIATLPEEYRTYVGREGKSLSGGQNQRISLARARLRDAPILILDESTSALDRETADIVMRNIRAWRQDRMTIIITHDLSHIKPDDYVYILAAGTVFHEGYRDTLEKSSDLADLLDSMGNSGMSGWEKESQEVSQYYDRELPKFSGEKCTRQIAHFDEDCKTDDREDDWGSERFSLSSESENLVAQAKSLATGSSKSARLGDGKRPFTEYIRLRRTRTGSYRRANRTRISKKDICVSILQYSDKAQKFRITISFICAAAHAAVIPLFSYCFSRLLGTHIHRRTSDEAPAPTWSAAILLLAIIDGISSYLMRLLLDQCSQRWVDNLRGTAFRRILDQPCAWFDENGHSPQELSHHLDQDAEDTRALSRFASAVLTAGLMMALALAYAFVVCWKITVASLAATPVLLVVTGVCSAVNTRWESRYTRAVQAANAVLDEVFRDIKCTKAWCLESHFRRKHSKITEDAHREGIKKATWSGLVFGISDATVVLLIACLYWYGSSLVAYEDFSVQSVLAVFSVLIFSLSNINTVLSQIPQLTTSLASARRLLELVNLPTPPTHQHPPSSSNAIELTDLSFAYPSRPTYPVLNHLTLTIPLNTSTAIVGPSGSGKSTLLALLANLHHPASYSSSPSPSSSSSSTNSQPPLAFPSHLFPFSIALSPQSPPIFPTTIRANIAYALPSSSSLASEENIMHAATIAGLEHFILSLPEGLDIVIGEEGMWLSGGQTARLGIARALCRRPEVLLLDEPTANLDEAGKRGVGEMIRGFVGEGGTVVVVTHDEGIMRACERVMRLS